MERVYDFIFQNFWFHICVACVIKKIRIVDYNILSKKPADLSIKCWILTGYGGEGHGDLSEGKQSISISHETYSSGGALYGSYELV